MEDRAMRNNLFKYILYSSTVAVILLLGLQPVQALEVKLSGQVNRAIMWADNGKDTEVLNVDNDNSSTRFSLTGSEQVNDSVTVGVVWENEFQSNASNDVDVGQDDDGTSAFNDRKLEAYFVVPFGKISIGQGDGAANGTSEEDLSGTSVIMYSGVNDTAGSIQFRDNNDTPIAKIDSTRSNFDGLSRNDRLRYDTPTFGGATFSVSSTNGGAYELAARYSADFDALGKITTAIGYVDANNRANPEYTQIGGSVSWLHTSGINLTVSSGARDIDNTDRDPVNYYGKLGYKFDIHAIAVEYGMTEDLAQDKDKSKNYGLAYVIKPWNGVEFYGTYRTYELDRDGTSNIEDVRQVMLGTRVKF
jgi:predicted porin